MISSWKKCILSSARKNVVSIILVVLATLANTNVAFCPSQPIGLIERPCRGIGLGTFALSNNDEISVEKKRGDKRTVNELLDNILNKDGESQKDIDQETVRSLITTLSSGTDQYAMNETTSSTDLFKPLVGYYNVSCTLTAKPNENPVGGKWTRGLWTVKRTMQHVLPTENSNETKPLHKIASKKGESEFVSANSVAQVINAIRLELFWGFVNIWVLLRGDAVPLKVVKQAFDDYDKSSKSEDNSSKQKAKKSPPNLIPGLTDRTVKAYFDRPKIGVSLKLRKKSPTPFWKRVLTLGPTSAVILDTPYLDDRIRLGKGGTSGSQFVFRRLPDSDTEGREGWQWVLESTSTEAASLTKNKLLLRVGVLTIVFGALSRVLQQQWMKVAASLSTLISAMSMIGLLRSTGGIETEGDTYIKGKP